MAEARMVEMKPKGRLLILDDDRDVGMTLSLIGARAGLDVRTATNARDFFEVLDSWCPTHITLDLLMPDTDGIEILRQLGANHCDASIIITSGVGSRVLDAAKRSAEEHGLRILGTLAKPFPSSKLRALLINDNATGTDNGYMNGPVNGRANGNGAAQTDVPATIAAARMAANDSTTFIPDEAAILDGLRRKEFSLVYQPKVNCKSGKIAGLEVFVRWNHPDYGVVAPNAFIPFAESHGLIDGLTDFIFEDALGWFAKTLPNSDLRLALNLSARSLNRIGLADELAAKCAAHGVDTKRITLELTETSAMTDQLTSLDVMARMRLKGFHLSIDDFGVGYSSLVQLSRLPFSELKIDKSFVSSALRDQESRKIIKAIIWLGRSMGLKTVAEGVEDDATLKYLRDSGCDFAQGYVVGRPVPASSVESHISRLL